MKQASSHKTVFIGIPAHNEEKNICALLDSILLQKTHGFTIDQIAVMCDGCTDNTANLVHTYHKQNKKVVLYNDGKRLGQGQRLNQLFKICKSDIFITFDGDVVLKNAQTISEFVKMFHDERVGLVGGHNIPTVPKTHVEAALVTYEQFWRDVTIKINNGDNIHNCPGCAWAASKILLKDLYIPKQIVASDHFVFLTAIKLKFSFKFANKARVLFKLPSTINDYMNQTDRFVTSQDFIEKTFGDFCKPYYQIPQQIKVNAYKKWLKKKFAFMIFSLSLITMQRIYSAIKSKKSIEPVWTQVTSSK